MARSPQNIDGLVAYGPHANCTLDLCPVEVSVVGYRPWLAANGTFLALFGIAAGLHLVVGLRWRTWSYTACSVLGCIDEIIGYAGRIILYFNPFSFPGFMMEIICITTAPVFFCAAIYVTLSKTIEHLDPAISRFPPRLLYWLFIPCDILSLAMQAAGGAYSSISVGKGQAGVDVSLAGLSLQVFTLFVFILVSADYFVRLHRSKTSAWVAALPAEFKVFVVFLNVAILLIFIRCCYRIGELSEGYTGPLFTDEGLFVGLESSIITVSAFCLVVANPGRGLAKEKITKG